MLGIPNTSKPPGLVGGTPARAVRPLDDALASPPLVRPPLMSVALRFLSALQTGWRSRILSRLALLPLICAIGCDDSGTTPGADASPPPDAARRDSGAASADAGPDARAPDDAGSDVDAGSTPIPTPTLCADRSAAIIAATGNTIVVSPAGDGQVMVDGSMRTLRQVVSGASEGDTILLEDGTYTLPSAGDGSYTGLYFTTPNVTLRSASGDPTRVVIDSAYRAHGGQTAAITVDAPGIVLADFTVQRSVFHLIHFWSNGDRGVVHDVILIDGGQQFLKVSPGGGGTVDDVEVGCSQFRMTPAGRDNVWGYGPSDGSTTCYTGGIDAHDGRSWQIHDNFFEGIYCDATGVARPAHGMSPSARGDQTYMGGLSEYAIHMWDSEAGSGHTIERNRIVNCARGIGLGMRAEVYDTVIRNNMIYSEFDGSREHDVGINLERAHDMQVDNNTVLFTAAAAYSNAIEYRWDSTSGVEIRNNLTNQRIRDRNGASASLSTNIVDAQASWFRDASRGDLHLATCDEASVVGVGTPLPSVPTDYDAEPRGASNDIGADDCAAD